jgi:hypothetical protein
MKRSFTFHSQEQGKRSLLWTFGPIVAIVTALAQIDPNLTQDLWWIFLGAGIALWILATGPYHSEKVLKIVVYPMGVQLMTYTNGQGVSSKLLPLEAVQDCIVQEQVLAHKVTSHVVFRLQKSGDSNVQLVPAFPGAELSFVKCLQLKTQVQSALDSLS